MVVGLVPVEEEERLYQRLMGYYIRLYPGVKFRRENVTLSKEQIGKLYYTYPGEETEATAIEKMKMINTAIGHGYSTPLIILRKVKDKKDILLDGHRRARVAWMQGMDWPAIVLVPIPEIKFGIEEMITGRIEELYGK